MSWQIKSNRNFFAFLVMPLFLVACGGGGGGGSNAGAGNSSNNGGSNGGGSPSPTITQDTPFAFVQRNIAVETQVKTDSFKQAISGQGARSPLDLSSPYQFNPGAKLITRSSLDVDGVDTDVLTSYFGSSDYDVKDLNVSPNGQFLIFAAHGPNNHPTDYTWNIYEYSFATKTMRRVIEDDAIANAGQDTNPTYALDGSIIFSSDRSAGNPNSPIDNIVDEEQKPFCYKVGPDEKPSLLHSMSNQGENILQLTYGRNHDTKPTTLKDGRVAFVRWTRTYSVIQNCPAADTGVSAKPAFSEFNQVFNNVDYPKGLDLPPQWTHEKLCALAQSTPMGKVVASNHYRILRITADGEKLEQLYKTVTLLGSDETFIGPDQLIQVEDGKLVTLLQHQYNSFMGGNVLQLQSPQAPASGKVFGNFSPSTLMADKVDLYPNQASVNGWYSAVWPYRDGTGRMLVSWSQCAAVDGGVSSFCTDGENEGDVTSQYGIWVVDLNKASRLPVVNAKKDTLYSDIAISYPQSGADFPYEPYDSDFVDDLDTSRLICTEPVNTPPVANAGADQQVLIGQTITLDGSKSSDIDGDALTYHWLITSPSETKAVLVNEKTVSPKITIKEHGTYVIQLIVNDGKADSAADTVSLEVGNVKPVANAGPDQADLPGTIFHLDGSKSTDADGDALTYRWRIASAPEGSTSELTGADTSTPSIAPDQYGVYTIELIVNDTYVDSDADTVVIDTSNAAPVANAGPDQQVAIGQTVTLNGSGSVDPDGDALQYYWTIISPSNTTAVLSSNTAVMPTLVIKEHGTYVVQLVVNDGKFNSAPDTVNLVVANTKPIANAGANQNAEPGDQVQLDGSLSRDQDGDALTYRWRVVSAPSGSAAQIIGNTTFIPTFTPDLYGMYTIELIVNDGYVDSEPDLMVIDASNAAPVANAGADQNVKVGQTVVLDGSKSTDADGDPLTYLWTIVSPSDTVAVITNNTSAAPSIEIKEQGTYVIQLVVNDGKTDSAPDTVSLTVENTKPVANAGVDKAANPGSLVQLDGSLSKDDDGDQLTYRWRIVSAPEGSAAELASADSVNPTLTTDAYGMYTVELIVNDGYVDSDADTVVIDASNAAPIANAGNDLDVYIDHTVNLDGSKSSDPDSDPITYLWTIISPSNTTTTIANNTAVMPSITIREQGTYVVQLVVNDGKVNSEPDTVTLTVVNSKPIANAGPDQSGDATEFQLDGSLSRDADKDPITYRWRVVDAPQGSAAEIVGDQSVKPTFTPDQYGRYTIELIVNDGKVDSNADTMVIDTTNAVPVANAGVDQQVSMGQLVTLDGSNSHDADGDLLTYKWTITSPSNTQAVLSDSAAVMPTLTIKEHGMYVVQLIVNDGKVDSAPDTVSLEVGNVKPVANAGVDQNNDPGNQIQLDGSLSSDVDGDLLNYSWRIVSAPDNSVAEIVGANTVNPTITPDQYGIYTIELVVNDGVVNSDADTMVINTLNNRPVADAGPDQSVRVNDVVALNGTNSSDADGDPLTYTWSVLSKPAGSSAALTDPAAGTPGITIDKAGSYVIQLIVNDGIQDSEADTVVLTTTNVRPVAEAGPTQTKYLGDTVTLDGSGSFDPDGDNITYQWAFTSKPTDSVATLMNDSIVGPQFRADKEGTYVVQLIVNDGALDSLPDTVIIKIEQPVCDISSATKRTLPVTIRDFDTRHPDFETYDGVETGIVKKTLGYLNEGGKPIYARDTGGSKTTTNKFYFDQWYRDVPGVNINIPYTLQMTREAGSTVWSYVNSDFFPINGQGFGNYKNDRNFHFTLEAHLEFDYKGGEVFTFRGDDDLWVFINGKLAIDIGGVHGVEQRTINLDQKAAELGIQKGQTYRFDLFFAERHTWKSNFMFQTNINLECVPGQQ